MHSSPEEAADALSVLAADREHLVASIHVPWTLLAAFGGLAAWWVSAAATTNPGADYEAPTTGWLAFAGALVVAYLIRRETGVRLKKMGALAAWAVVAIIVVCLVLFSVSLALVSLGAHWAVAVTSALAFGATTWLAGVAYRSAREKLRNE